MAEAAPGGVALESVLSVKEAANPFTNHLLSRSLMEKYLFKTIGQKEQLFYKQVTAVTSQNPRLDFLFLEPTTSKREEVSENELAGIKRHLSLLLCQCLLWTQSSI